MKPVPGGPLAAGDVETDEREWNDWRWQLRHAIKSSDELARYVALSGSERDGLERSQDLFRFGVTPYYASLMHPSNPSCPIRMQAIPSPAELQIRDEERTDPLGEEDYSPTPALVHKYPDRALLLCADRCAVYCRHCNRRRLVGANVVATPDRIGEAIDHLARNRRIRDVLLSGGDPLLLTTDRLAEILEKLRSIPHIEIIRIGTRVPVVLPMRIDAHLVAALRAHHPLFVNTHFNHPAEVTPEARTACERLVDAGIPVGNQTVLLRGVNSSVRCLRRLMRDLLSMRVKPYYLFQGDTAAGTDHLRTPVEEAIRLMDGLRGWISGMAIPHLVIDAPGGGGKIPIGPPYLRAMNSDWVTLRNYRGSEVRYPQPRETDCGVPYDEVFFAGEHDDDDREGGELR